LAFAGFKEHENKQESKGEMRHQQKDACKGIQESERGYKLDGASECTSYIKLSETLQDTPEKEGREGEK
jgi:hypothetical protein